MDRSSTYKPWALTELATPENEDRLNKHRVCGVTMSGCGGYADNKSGASSTTGHGEAFMKTCVAKHAAILMEQGEHLFTLLFSSSAFQQGCNQTSSGKTKSNTIALKTKTLAVKTKTT